jgi:hypothetical protein
VLTAATNSFVVTSAVAVLIAATVATMKSLTKERTTMPQFTFSQALTANQLGFNPLAGWQYEYLPWPAQVILLIRATDNNERMTLYSGSETIQERSPVQGGGVAGTTPTEFTTAPVSFIAAAGDRLKVVIDNTTAGTPTVDGVIIINPA